MKKLKTLGQITLLTALIGASATIFASAIGGWFTASSKINSVDTKVQIIEEREQNHYLEIEKRLNSIETKIDKLISNGK
jgi:TolA-binding protein